MGERYKLVEKLGTGGMATVWKAIDQTLNRPVAIKRLLPHLASDPAVAARFQSEARAVASLSHRGIVSIYDTGTDEEGPYIVLELVEGETLAKRIETSGPLSLSVTAGIVIQIADALDYAHEQGVVHRDIKPANLIIDANDKVHLADFGIARSINDTASITRPGELAGTLLYLAPEIVQGGRATPASDIYSLAAVTVQLLTGRPPYEAENVGALLAKVQEGNTSDFATDLPDEVAPVLTSAMAADPSMRPLTAGQFASSLLTNTTLVMAPDDLSAVSDSKPVTAVAVTTKDAPRAKPVKEQRNRPRRSKSVPLVVGLLALGALIVTAAALSGDDPASSNVPTTAGFVAPSDETTTIPTTTTTTPTTTTETTIVVPTPETVADEIATHLGELSPPTFKPKDVKQVREKLDDLMKTWREGDADKIDERLKKLGEAVDDLAESSEQSHLHDHVVELAGLMGVDFESED